MNESDEHAADVAWANATPSLQPYAPEPAPAGRVERLEPAFDAADPRNPIHTPTAHEPAEAAMLTAVMDDPAHARDLLRDLSVLSFAATDSTARVARAVFALLDEGRLPDVTEVGNRAGQDHVRVVYGALPTSSHLEGAYQVLRENEQRRYLRTLARRLIADAEDPGKSPKETMVATETALQAFGTRAGDVATVDAEAGVAGALDALTAYGKPGAKFGLQTGLDVLDDRITGLRPGELVLVAGRPGQGKTTLACQIAREAAVRGEAVVIAAYETGAAQLYENMLCAEANVDAHLARRGTLSEADWHALTLASERLRRAPLLICDDRGADVTDIRRVAQRVRAIRPLALLVVDYIQLVPALGNTHNREQEVASVSRALKALAGELACPVLALSQLNRGVEQRQEGEPRLADLRESGALEQDADAVILIHRPSRDSAEVRLVVAKQRHGPVGTVSVAFLRDRLRFAKFSPESGAGGVDRMEF